MKELNEKDDRATIDEWFVEAKKQTVDTIADFIKKLATEYNHDYGTICHAIAAAAIGGIYAVEHGPQGGITGFQAGAIQWEIIRHWGAFGTKDAPMRFIDFNNLLYPQYDDDFTKISADTWEWAQKRATELLNENKDASDSVIAHWKSIAEGNVPFGLHVETRV